MTRSEILEEYREVQKKIDQLDALIKASEDHVMELKKERYILRDRSREILMTKSDDYNSKLKSITLVYREDLDVEDILRNGIEGIKI